MRTEIKLYLGRPHRTRKHVAATLLVLRKFWRESRRLDSDVWDNLSSYGSAAAKEAVNGSAIKGAFRDFALRLQHGRCCYCRCWLPATPYAMPIEHILPRNAYRRFSVDFWNLAVACVDCNLAKGSKAWTSIPAGTAGYPRRDAFPGMFHPRYHSYNEHVRFIVIETNGVSIALYRGRTQQGNHLCLNLLDKIASKRALLNNNPELQESLQDIDRYRAATGTIVAPALDAFAKTVDSRLMDLIRC